jgi:hypothetical protein
LKPIKPIAWRERQKRLSALFAMKERAVWQAIALQDFDNPVFAKIDDQVKHHSGGLVRNNLASKVGTQKALTLFKQLMHRLQPWLTAKLSNQQTKP